MKKHRNIINGLVGIGAVLLVASTALFAAVHIVNKYPDRMWHDKQPPDTWSYTNMAGEVCTLETTGLRLGMMDGTNIIMGRLGVVRMEGDYVVIWEPVE